MSVRDWSSDVCSSDLLGIAEWCGGKGNKTGAINAFEKARNDRAWRKMAEYEMDKVKNPQKYEK
jgi:hypothetical protein